MKSNCWKMDRGSLTRLKRNCKHWTLPEKCTKSRFPMTSVSNAKSDNKINIELSICFSLNLQKSSRTIHRKPVVLRNNRKMVKTMVQALSRLNRRRQPCRYVFFFIIGLNVASASLWMCAFIWLQVDLTLSDSDDEVVPVHRKANNTIQASATNKGRSGTPVITNGRSRTVDYNNYWVNKPRVNTCLKKIQTIAIRLTRIIY